MNFDDIIVSISCFHIYWNEIYLLGIYPAIRDILLFVFIHFFCRQIDPRGRPTVLVGSNNNFHTCSPSVRLRSHFSKSSKTKQYSSENSYIATGGTEGLAKGIIDDTCLVYYIFRWRQSLFSELWPGIEGSSGLSDGQWGQGSLLLLRQLLQRRWKNFYKTSCHIHTTHHSVLLLLEKYILRAVCLNI